MFFFFFLLFSSLSWKNQRIVTGRWRMTLGEDNVEVNLNDTAGEISYF